jgi:NhaP-type Na+/H+ or K+/H+ antiporter
LGVSCSNDPADVSGFFNKATEDAVFSNVIDLLFNSAAFIYIGAILPFDDFNSEAVGYNRNNADESYRFGG